jgi:hypothetical protein
MATATASAWSKPAEPWAHIKLAYAEAERYEDSSVYTSIEPDKQRALLDLVSTAAGRVDELVRDGRIDAPTAELLKQDLRHLESSVQSLRSKQEQEKEQKQVPTCYEPSTIPTRAPGLERLEAQLPLVAKMLEARRLDREVVSKVLARLELEVSAAERHRSGPGTPSEMSAKDQALLASLRAKLEALRARFVDATP